jgi:hypothetical protein
MVEFCEHESYGLQHLHLYAFKGHTYPKPTLCLLEREVQTTTMLFGYLMNQPTNRTCFYSLVYCILDLDQLHELHT